MKRVELEAGAAGLARRLLEGFAPVEDIKVSEWAERHRVIPRGNAEPGAWRNDRAPYTVEPADAVSDDSLSTIVITGCSQSGKTAGCGENVVGWAASVDPCTIVWATPSDASATAAASRFDAMIAATPELKKRFAARTARSTLNNSALKEFEGGKLVIVSAGSPASLASHPSRLVIADEVDRFPISLRKEGDPIGLLKARQTTFARRKFIALSSPTQVGASRIEALFETGDQREWHWKCDCGAEHVPEWEHVKFEPGAPQTAAYHMPCCGTILSNAERIALMQRGRWIAGAEGQPGVRSYRFRGLSSPWLSLELLAAEFEAAKGIPAKLQPFYNTRLGLPFEGATGEGIDAQAIKDLAENYHGDHCPRDAALITAAIDVQGGWVMVGIVAWGEADEGWVLQLHEVPGDVKDPATWEKVDELLLQEFKHPSGATMPISAVACDAGYETQHVVEWSIKNRAKGRRWYATIGRAGWDRPLWARGGDIARSMAKVWIVGADQGKQQVLGGLATADAGPAKLHMRADFQDHYFAWATAEELVTLPTGKREWKLKRGERRNEVLDVLTYNLAVKHSADFNVEALLERLHTTGSLKPKSSSLADLAARAAALSGAQNV